MAAVENGEVDVVISTTTALSLRNIGEGFISYS
jgi:hypothetical protein